MNIITCIRNFCPSFLLPSLQKKNDPIKKIETLNQRLLSAEGLLSSDQSYEKGLFKLKEILIDEARLQNQHSLCLCKIRLVYQAFSNNLKRVQERHASTERLRAWLNETPQTPESLRISRWLQSCPSQRRFAAYYGRSEVPYKFSEIPPGSILVTYPFAYIRHMLLEKRLPFFKTIAFLIKAFVCRVLTGKQFSHVGLSMGNGDIFDLDNGKGQIKKYGDKIFYGIVLTPNQQKMLDAYHHCFPQAPRIGFSELTGKINDEIRRTTATKNIRHNLFDIIKTSILIQRPIDYRCTEVWKSGKCHLGCSATTSALFSYFGIDIGKQFNKVNRNITPADFYESEFFLPTYLIPYRSS